MFRAVLVSSHTKYYYCFSILNKMYFIHEKKGMGIAKCSVIVKWGRATTYYGIRDHVKFHSLSGVAWRPLALGRISSLALDEHPSSYYICPSWPLSTYFTPKLRAQVLFPSYSTLVWYVGLKLSPSPPIVNTCWPFGIKGRVFIIPHLQIGIVEGRV